MKLYRYIVLAGLSLTLSRVPGLAQSVDSVAPATATVTGEVSLIQASSAQAERDASKVVVWLVPVTGIQQVSRNTQKTHYRLLQRDKRFEPGLLVISVGGIVDYPNADPWFHNVFSLYRGKRFDLGLYQAGGQRSVKFDRLGPSYLFCNIHPEMTGVVLAVETSLFGISDKSGRYSIAGVPAGKYVVHVWYENATPESLQGLERTIEIGDSRLLPSISVPVVQQIQAAHKNKYGQDYDPETLKPDY